MPRSNYAIVVNDPAVLVLQDLGPWDTYLTITNDAENVVKELAPVLLGRRLFYIDSEGDKTEIIYNGDKFVTFVAPV